MKTESELYDIDEQINSFGKSYNYTLTPGELGWLDFVRGRYSIADYLIERMTDNRVELDSDLSQALDDDCEGFGKAVCLSDDTDLQAIFFYCYRENEGDIE